MNRKNVNEMTKEWKRTIFFNIEKVIRTLENLYINGRYFSNVEDLSKRFRIDGKWKKK